MFSFIMIDQHQVFCENYLEIDRRKRTANRQKACIKSFWNAYQSMQELMQNQGETIRFDRIFIVDNQGFSSRRHNMYVRFMVRETFRDYQIPHLASLMNALAYSFSDEDGMEASLVNFDVDRGHCLIKIPEIDESMEKSFKRIKGWKEARDHEKI